MRTFRDKAIVLRTYRLGEADRIVVALGQNTGQFRAVAKGVRRSRSKFGSRLESFNLVDCQVYRGKSLHTVTQAETISPYSSWIAPNYEAFTNAKLVVEAAQKITDGDELPNPEQFGLLHGAVNAFALADRPPTLVASSYLFRALALEGWEPLLDVCATCGAGNNHVGFSPAAGGVVCADCAPADAARLPPGTLALLEALLRGNWGAASQSTGEQWEHVARLAGAWAQFHLEQRLKALPFAATQPGRN